MTHAQQAIEINPSPASVDTATLAERIEAYLNCARARTACADACLGEQDIQMLARCIRFDLDCADVCGTTRRSSLARGHLRPSGRTACFTRAPARVASAGKSANNAPRIWSPAVIALRFGVAATAPATTSHRQRERN